MAANRQIQIAARRIAEQVYGAISKASTPAARAQLLRYALNGLAPGLSARVSAAVERLMAQGARMPARRAVVLAIEKELSSAMHAQAGEPALSGLGTMSAADISGLIRAVGSTASTLTTTIGNTVTASRQGRQVQLPATPIVPPPLAPVAPLAPAAPITPAYAPPTPVPPSAPPWGWIIGGVVAVAAIGGGAWYYSKQSKK
jgi:hypothetical protein